MQLIIRWCSRPLALLFSISFPLTALADRMPGGPEWWDVTACDTQGNQLVAALISFSTAHQAVVSNIPGWRRFCSELRDPVEAVTCMMAVDAIEENTLLALEKGFKAVERNGYQGLKTSSVIAYARTNNIGGQALPANAFHIAQLTKLALKVHREGVAVSAQASLMVGASEHTHVIAQRIAILPNAINLTNIVRMNSAGFAESANQLSACYIRIVTDILTKAAVGLGGWGQLPGPGPVGGSEGDTLPGFLLEGPFTPQAKTYFRANPIVFDLDRYDSYLTQGTRLERHEHSEYFGKVYRQAMTFYRNTHAELDEDLYVPDPLTLLPVLYAPRGTPIVLWPISVGSDPWIGLVGGNIVIGAGQLDIFHIEADEQCNPLPGAIWGILAQIPWYYPPYIYRGGLGVLELETTGSPDEIARGEKRSMNKVFRSTSGIIDPETGAHVPGEDFAGYCVRFEKTVERPEHTCWTWDESQQRYLWPFGCS